MLQLQLFTEESTKSTKFRRFEMTTLGQLFKTLPLKELASLFPKKSNVGRPGILTIEGGIALMYLKSYTQLSDEKLVASLNSDWCYQMFCGVQFNDSQWINDVNFVGKWRARLAEHLDVEQFQSVLVNTWKADIPHQETATSDATVYESYVRFPTDSKLLWESCEWVFQKLFSFCKFLKVKKPRFKYNKQKKAYLGYAKTRKKTYKQKRTINKKLLYLLNQGLTRLIEITEIYGDLLVLDKKLIDKLEVIKKVLEQQQELYETGETAGKDRIISLAKPYLRVIKRGKETHPNEFGIKANILQVGGGSFVEHLSFNAFHEGNRLEPTVQLHEKYFGHIQMFGADQLYATRANRKYCKAKGISTSFVPLGRKPKDEKKSDKKVARDALNKERSTVLEGSFGNQKNHYNLSKVKAKTMKTEILWVVFGIWTASAMKIASLRAKKKDSNKTLKTSTAA